MPNNNKLIIFCGIALLFYSCIRSDKTVKNQSSEEDSVGVLNIKGGIQINRDDLKKGEKNAGLFVSLPSDGQITETKFGNIIFSMKWAGIVADEGGDFNIYNISIAKEKTILFSVDSVYGVWIPQFDSVLQILTFQLKQKISESYGGGSLYLVDASEGVNVRLEDNISNTTNASFLKIGKQVFVLYINEDSLFAYDINAKRKVHISDISYQPELEDELLFQYFLMENDKNELKLQLYFEKQDGIFYCTKSISLDALLTQ